MPPIKTTIVQEFLNYLSFQKRYSKNTIIAYQNDIETFFGYSDREFGEIELKEISQAVIRTWLASLKEQKLSARSINRKISSLKSFFRFCLKMNRIEVNPAVSTSSLKTSRRLPSFITEKDIKKLFSENDFPDTFMGKMDYLILSIFYQTGMRRSELINLKEGDIDQRDSNIKILGKGNKERRIPVGNDLLKLIASYMEEKRKEFGPACTDFLFTNKSGKLLNPKYIYNMVKRNIRAVSTNERASPHVLRHTFATHLTNEGAPLNDVKELLGHSSLASTQVYTHNSIEKLKQVYKQAHPKS